MDPRHSIDCRTPKDRGPSRLGLRASSAGGSCGWAWYSLGLLGARACCSVELPGCHGVLCEAVARCEPEMDVRACEEHLQKGLENLDAQQRHAWLTEVANTAATSSCVPAKQSIDHEWFAKRLSNLASMVCNVTTLQARKQRGLSCVRRARRRRAPPAAKSEASNVRPATAALATVRRSATVACVAGAPVVWGSRRRAVWTFPVARDAAPMDFASRSVPTWALHARRIPGVAKASTARTEMGSPPAPIASMSERLAFRSLMIRERCLAAVIAPVLMPVHSSSDSFALLARACRMVRVALLDRPASTAKRVVLQQHL